MMFVAGWLILSCVVTLGVAKFCKAGGSDA